MTTATHPIRTAAVFGGGGVAGIAWEIGVLAGLARAGVPVHRADLFVGTSAGSVVGAQLACGMDIEALLHAQLYPPADSPEQFRPYSQAEADAQNRKLVAKVDGDLTAARQRIGDYARHSETPTPSARRAIVAARLPQAEWPERPLRVTAVDTETGLRRVFDASQRVPLVEAVAASCAVPGVWPPVMIGGAYYMDGGIASMTNADVAIEAGRVFVLSPFGYSEGNPVSGHLGAEVAALQAAGCAVHVVAPSPASLEAMGENVLDPARRPASAAAGLEQGATLAHAIRGWWVTAMAA